MIFKPAAHVRVSLALCKPLFARVMSPDRTEKWRGFLAAAKNSRDSGLLRPVVRIIRPKMAI